MYVCIHIYIYIYIENTPSSLGIGQNSRTLSTHNLAGHFFSAQPSTFGGDASFPNFS